MCFCGQIIFSRSEKHPKGDSCNRSRRGKHEVGLRLFGDKLVAKLQRDGGQCPNDQGVGQGGAKAKQGRLGDGALHRDDEGGHHGLGMPGFESMKRS